MIETDPETEINAIFQRIKSYRDFEIEHVQNSNTLYPCPADHRVPKEEARDHFRICPDLREIERFILLSDDATFQHVVSVSLPILEKIRQAEGKKEALVLIGPQNELDKPASIPLEVYLDMRSTGEPTYRRRIAQYHGIEIDKVKVVNLWNNVPASSTSHHFELCHGVVAVVSYECPVDSHTRNHIVNVPDQGCLSLSHIS